MKVSLSWLPRMIMGITVVGIPFSPMHVDDVDENNMSLFMILSNEATTLVHGLQKDTYG